MIVVESKKSKRATIEKRYPNAVIIDVTSRSEDEYVKFSPFYPHGGIPVPYSQGVYGKSVEGIWQGLKVFENTGISKAAFDNDTMKNLKRTVAKYGRVRGHQKGVFSKELLDYGTARRQIYARIYRWVLDHKVQNLVTIIRNLSASQTVVLLDYNTNGDIDDTSTPLSHASLIKAYIEGNYPTFESDGVIMEASEEGKKPFEMNFEVGQRVKHYVYGEGVVTEIRGGFVNVDFGGNVKTFRLGFAKLEVVKEEVDEV